MTKQDKATTDRHAKTLRELVKLPENKVCADCKRNDPRWASWNLGVFVCIRCSGIHRSMGTHISKVKSVDLDVWTPEQMQSIQKWGNARANLYWEAHLKPGHVPPDHKMESFIRSKYESKRWTLEGPPPSDPSILENSDGTSTTTNSTPLPPPPPSPPAITAPQQAAPPQSQRTHTLLSTQLSRGQAVPRSQAAKPVPTPAPPPPVPEPAQNDLFTLDFHAPVAAPAAPSSMIGSPPAGNKNVKDDILSLFSSSSPAGSGVLGGGFDATGPGVNAFGGGFGTGGFQQQPQQTPQVTSMMGATGWGSQPQGGWVPHVPPSPNIWASPSSQQPAQSNAMFSTQNVWGGSVASNPDLFSSPFSTAPVPAKKDDAFGDLWGGFK